MYSSVFHMAAITTDGNLYTWGKNKWGQLGLGHTKDQYFPLQVSSIFKNVFKTFSSCNIIIIGCKIIFRSRSVLLLNVSVVELIIWLRFVYHTNKAINY